MAFPPSNAQLMGNHYVMLSLLLISHIPLSSIYCTMHSTGRGLCCVDGAIFGNKSFKMFFGYRRVGEQFEL